MQIEREISRKAENELNTTDQLIFNKVLSAIHDSTIAAMHNAQDKRTHKEVQQMISQDNFLVLFSP